MGPMQNRTQCPQLARLPHERGPDGRNQPPSLLLKSSRELAWSNLVGELRSHSPCEKPGGGGQHVEFAIAVQGCDEGTVACKVAGTWRSVQPTTGAIWLFPIDGKAEEIHIRSPHLQTAHLYLPKPVFAGLMDDHLPTASSPSIRYSCGVTDDVIHQIGLAVMSEMMSPTAAGRMFVETASLLLAARLAQMHAETALVRPPTKSHDRLDQRRLNRVLAYIEEHLADEITVETLAGVACLSVFHFTRVFAAAVGVPPHRYVSQRRLQVAKEMIATGRASLFEIARAS